MEKKIHLEQPTIPTNKVLEGTENYINYCFLAASLLGFLMLLFGIMESQDLLILLFIPGVFVVGGNVYSFNMLAKKLEKKTCEDEIDQLNVIIDAEPQNANAYFKRGERKKQINQFAAALYDFKKAQKLKTNLSDYFEKHLDNEIHSCIKGAKKQERVYKQKKGLHW
jgi:hypothetical protein